MLKRSLFRRLSTGEVANQEFLQFTFPPRYRYDVLRALDYFRSTGTAHARMEEAVKMVESKQRADGTWLLDGTCNEALPLPFPEQSGAPSRWNTLRAMRILRWYGRKTA